MSLQPYALHFINRLIINMLPRNNVGCRVFAELAYTERNEMSYGNKPNVLARTVTIMTADCRSLTVGHKITHIWTDVTPINIRGGDISAATSYLKY